MNDQRTPEETPHPFTGTCCSLPERDAVHDPAFRAWLAVMEARFLRLVESP